MQPLSVKTLISMWVKTFNLQGTQRKQQCDCNRLHQLPNVINVGQEVPLKIKK